MEQRGREALLLQLRSALQRREKLKVSTELVEPRKGSRTALSSGAVWELGMFAITKASAFCCHPDMVASINVSSHLSFDLSRGNIPSLFECTVSLEGLCGA